MNAFVKKLLIVFSSIVLQLGSTFLHAAESESLSIEMIRVFDQVETPKPISLVTIPDDSGRSLLVLQGGRVILLSSGFEKGETSTFLNIPSELMIDNAFEEGLLGLVFHPNYERNGLFYLYHSLQNPKRTVLVERRVSNTESLALDKSHNRLVLEIEQPYWNHNSGVPEFGPDGYLYLSTGDGGKANDPHDFAQNTFSLLGKVLRLDVNKREGDLAYGIPADNPFRDKPGYRGEIWTLGMRNPWRLHWDFPSQTLYCADVGQNLSEEINLIKKGGNYGWSYREGAGVFPLKHKQPPEEIEFVGPVFEYGHSEGTSVSGGYVYRDKEMPSLYGHYLFGDWGTGKCWAIKVINEEVVEQKDLKFVVSGEVINGSALFVNGKPKSPFKPVNFCPTPDGRIVILDWMGLVYLVG
tara:strand:- start:1018 stop:2247 length:1230 start_codon:yes stop_codon:yes gene_type:complete